jgi:signal transduction histidine kinase
VPDRRRRRGPVLGQLGVGPALRSLISRFQADTGVEMAVNIDLDIDRGRTARRLDPEVENTLYRLVQEALTNVAKQADARRVAVDVVERNARIQLRVSDDGRGFDPEAETDGFGMLGMRERVDVLKGALRIDARRGQGCTVHASIPATHVDEAGGAGSVSRGTGSR